MIEVSQTFQMTNSSASNVNITLRFEMFVLILTPLSELLSQCSVDPAHQQDQAQVHYTAGDIGDGPCLRSKTNTHTHTYELIQHTKRHTLRGCWTVKALHDHTCIYMRNQSIYIFKNEKQPSSDTCDVPLFAGRDSQF